MHPHYGEKGLDKPPPSGYNRPTMKIAFDIGGVISKYPREFFSLINSLLGKVEIYIISDIHPKEEIVQLLNDNGFCVNNSFIPEENIYCADYQKYGEMCKAILCKELRIDIFIDDFPGYLQWDSQLGQAPIRLLVMPDGFKPYWSPSWNVTSGNFDFGRRVSPIDL